MKDVYSTKNRLIENGIMLFLAAALYKFAFLFDGKDSLLGNGVYGPSSKMVLFISLLLLLLLILFRKKIKAAKFFVPIFIFEAVILILDLTTGTIGTIDRIIHYVVLPVLYLCVIHFCDSKRRLSYFLLLIEIGSLIICLLLLFQSYAFMAGGKSFLHIYFLESGIWHAFRNDSIRIVENDVMYLLSFCIGVALVRFSEKKGMKYLSIANCIIISIYEFFVSQTRMFMLAILMVVLASVFFDSGSIRKKQFIHRGLLILIVMVVVVAGWDVIAGRLSFSSSETSIVMRLGGYYFYIITGILNLPFGIGFNKVSSIYYTADIGIVGLFAKYGIITTICYLYIIIKSVKDSRGINDKLLKSINKNIIVLFVFLSPFIVMLDVEQIMPFAVGVALLEINTKKNWL